MKILTQSYWKEVFDPEMIVKTTLQTIIGTLLVGLFFMLFADFVFKPIDLNGRWTLLLSPDDALGTMNRCVDLEYSVLVVQRGVAITASGEKTEDLRSPRSECAELEVDGPDGVRELGHYLRAYSPGRGSQIEIEGFVVNHYFSPDLLTFSYAEGSKRRFTMAVLESVDDERLTGTYESNISRARGRATLVRSGG